jgi:hypothetical protein|nr:MAG TPA: hypothetical protein [Caudoviricetes sp.]
MYENLFNLIDDLQKAAMKIKIQEVLNTLCEDERVHEMLDADVVLEYYEKIYEHFEKYPKDFLFPNREWLRESLDRLGKSYGWFTGAHHFSIGFKYAVEYMYSSPDDITNINGAYNKAHGSVKKLRSNFKGFSFGRSDKNSVRYMMNWAQDHTDKLLTELADNFLEEKKHRSRNIARNTKFVVREMTGMSNKDYKAFLKKFKEKEVMRYDETSQCFEDILKISSLEFDHEVILEAVDVYNRNVYHLNKALLKLKERLNEEKDQ